jgi:hypothetical protein
MKLHHLILKDKNVFRLAYPQFFLPWDLKHHLRPDQASYASGFLQIEKRGWASVFRSRGEGRVGDIDQNMVWKGDKDEWEGG